MKYLPLYYEWLEKGMPEPGLCACFDQEPKALFYKFDWAFELVFYSVTGKISGLYWGDDDPGFYSSSEFTDLRQTIVLLCAALNGEL